MSDGIEAIINTNTAVREVRNNIETAPVVTPTVKKASVHTAWKSLLSDLGLGAVIPVVTIVIWQLAGNSG